MQVAWAQQAWVEHKGHKTCAPFLIMTTGPHRRTNTIQFFLKTGLCRQSITKRIQATGVESTGGMKAGGKEVWRNSPPTQAELVQCSKEFSKEAFTCGILDKLDGCHHFLSWALSFFRGILCRSHLCSHGFSQGPILLGCSVDFSRSPWYRS